MKTLMFCSSIIATLPTLGACASHMSADGSSVSSPEYTLHIGATLVDSSGQKVTGTLGVASPGPGAQAQSAPPTKQASPGSGPIDITQALAGRCKATVTSAKGVALYPGTPTEADIAAQVGQEATLTLSCPEGKGSQTVQATLDASNEVDLNFGNLVVDFPVANLSNDDSSTTVDTDSTLNIAGTVTFQAVQCNATPNQNAQVTIDPISGLVTVTETLSSSTYADPTGKENALCATLQAMSTISMAAGSPYKMTSSGNVYTFKETITPGNPVDNLVYNISDQVTNPANGDTYNPTSQETLTIKDSNMTDVNFGSEDKKAALQ